MSLTRNFTPCILALLYILPFYCQGVQATDEELISQSFFISYNLSSEKSLATKSIAHKLDPETSYYVRRLEINRDPRDYAHHFIIEACAEPAVFKNGTWDSGYVGESNTGLRCNAEKPFKHLYSYAITSRALTVLPENISFHIGKGTPYKYIVIETGIGSVEFVSIASKLLPVQDTPYQGDNNMVYEELIIGYQTTRTPLLGGMFAIMNNRDQGTIWNEPDLPDALTERDTYDHTCTKSDTLIPRTQDWMLFNYRVHTHNFAISASAFIVRDRPSERFLESRNIAGQKEWELLFKRTPFPLSLQSFTNFDEYVLLKPEETVASRCFYDGSAIDELEYEFPDMCDMSMMYYIAPDEVTGLSEEAETIGNCFHADPMDNWYKRVEDLGPIPEWVERVSTSP